MKHLENKRVKVIGGWGDSEYTAYGYSDSDYYDNDPGLLGVRLDSGSYHYYNVENITVVPDSFNG